MHGLPPSELERTLENGILTGLAAGVPMGLFMMAASATWVEDTRTVRPTTLS